MKIIHVTIIIISTHYSFANIFVYNSRPTKYQRYTLPSIRFDSQLLHSTHLSFFVSYLDIVILGPLSFLWFV